VHKNKPIAGPEGAGQLTLNFEPALPERFGTLREFLAHRVQVQAKPAKSIAMDMDMSPSTLSRKLAPGDGDTQRFNVDDLERYIDSTGDTACIEYLAAKYLESNEARRLRMLSRAEQMLPELARLLSAMQETQ
jgi:DNA-binding transcriptional ArsR family regulator